MKRYRARQLAAILLNFGKRKKGGETVREKSGVALSQKDAFDAKFEARETYNAA